VTVLVDSDILIDVSRARDQHLISRWMELSESEARVLCSPVSVAELWGGVLPNEAAIVRRLFRALPCITIDEEVGRQAGLYMLQYRKSHGLHLADALIAATAVLNGAELWTRNRKHYPMKEVRFF
jgi:predicted nucleic acid-binding protein